MKTNQHTSGSQGTAGNHDTRQNWEAQPLESQLPSLSQYLENPGIKHWHSFLHFLHYLKGSSNIGLRYKKDGAQGISAWSDADWGNCCSTRHSLTGYLATFNNSLVLWKTRKQPLVSISTAEAEYKALCNLTSELIWLKQWCAEAKILQLTQPITVWEDIQSCINISNGNFNFNNQRMKNVDIQLHFVKEVIQSSIIKLHYSPSTEMLADFLTKSVNGVSLDKSLKALGILRIGVRGMSKNLIQSVLDLILLSTPIPKGTKAVVFSTTR
ncbi:hypothetical protein O181_050314 [Austropuccinia psidii MF-1]|uniref:RNase H type-1 domain-containing protein n=1 Tax=Austropuccinia psidii MF-1 TaxID=1389203 RepID=A0A9Q3DWL5_9BASI|nr:hypothetical protein [Austropuccinia psidii MF-1]